MVSLEPCRLTKSPAQLLLALAAFAALPAALAQPEIAVASIDAPAGDAFEGDTSSDIVARVEEVRAREGSQSPELVGPMTALALQYQEEGEHAFAIAAAEQARQVVRINYGLHSMLEAPLLQQLIVSEEARGNAAGAWDIEQKLLDLMRRHPGDVRTVPIFREIARKRLDVLGRYVGGEFPPQIVLGCYYSRGWGGAGSCRAGSRGIVKTTLLNEAVSYYTRAINTSLRAEGYSSEEVPDLLMEVVHISYEYGRGGLGRRSLDYLSSYRAANGAVGLERAEGLIAIADWDLVFARGNRDLIRAAHDGYQAAYTQLERAGVERQLVEQMFEPEVPIAIPAFRPNPLVSNETARSSGFIDVAFEIDERGETRRIDVLDTTTASDGAQDVLVDLIEDTLFRPRVTAAGVAETSRVVLRYYVND